MTSILMVATSHGDIDGKPATGVWFSEFSEPFDAFIEAGVEVTVASPRGGPSPIDPRGYPKREEIAAVRDALERLNATLPLSAVRAEDFDGIFMPGGHGPMFDLATDRQAKLLIAKFWHANKPVGAVCHGPAALLDIALNSGSTLLNGRRVTGFTRGEDAVDALFEHMPFSLQDRMTAEGARFVEQAPRSVHVETDGLLGPVHTTNVSAKQEGPVQGEASRARRTGVRERAATLPCAGPFCFPSGRFEMRPLLCRAAIRISNRRISRL